MTALLVAAVKTVLLAIAVVAVLAFVAQHFAGDDGRKGGGRK